MSDKRAECHGGLTGVRSVLRMTVEGRADSWPKRKVLFTQQQQQQQLLYYWYTNTQTRSTHTCVDGILIRLHTKRQFGSADSTFTSHSRNVCNCCFDHDNHPSLSLSPSLPLSQTQNAHMGADLGDRTGYRSASRRKAQGSQVCNNRLPCGTTARQYTVGDRAENGTASETCKRAQG